jgi:[acyl-carrier-protein] S-malonyltransferase
VDKIAFLFTGQGAQHIGMGKDICEKFPKADSVFNEASDVLGFNIKKLVFEGKNEELMKTENTQPSILTTSIATLRILQDANINANFATGLSLGEYGAHIASESLVFSQAVSLVKKRGKFMQEEVNEGIGGMAAILGLTDEEVKEICLFASEKGIVEPANFNCPGQVVISGEILPLEYACEIAQERGAKKTITLPISAPFHSSMLKGAGDKLSNELENININDMKIPIVSNVTGNFIKLKEEIKDLLVRQVSSPVFFGTSLRKLIDVGVKIFIEVGPGKALGGFVKKIDPSAKTYSTENLSSLEEVLNEFSN